MTPEEKSLPSLVAPPLSPAATFDLEVAVTHEVEWLGEAPTLQAD
jgi:hypothetical protein